MSEELKLLPCPHCGHPATLWAVDMSGGVYVFCDGCGMRGPLTEEMTEQEAITAWNALPRRLRWTKEKPIEPGWYWFRYPNGRKFVWHINGDVVTSHKGTIMALGKVQTLGGRWAGPILEPEPEEVR